MSDRPGKELPKDWRAICTRLVDEQGWTYRNRGGHSMLHPADKSQQPVIVPHSASDHRAFRNFQAQVRRAGGIV